MLELRDASYAVGENLLLHPTSASFRKGTVTGLIGPNGASKSTMMRLLAGLAVPAEGDVLYDAVPLSQFSLRERARTIAFMPQDLPPFPPMPVQETASLGRLPYAEAPDIALQHPAVLNALTLTGLTSLARRPASRLSGGEKARLSLARALATEAPVLLADEPVAALDPAHALNVMETFRTLARLGHCVVVVIHDLLLAARFCDQLMILKDGVLRYNLPAHDLTGEIIREMYGVTTRTVENFLIPWDPDTGENCFSRA